MNRLILKIVASCLVGSICTPTATAQRQMERLGRGLTAMRSNSTQVYVGWRLLGNDPQDVAFNLYRSANGAAAVKLNASPLTATTDYLDTPPSLGSISYSYSVKPVIAGVEVTDIWANALTAPVTLPANPPTRQYTPVPLQPTPDGALDVKFCWVGDLDGDGEFDFVVDRQSAEGFRQFLEAYKRDGTLLWRIDLGPNSFYKYNIEPGSSSISIGHGDNVTVYDMDGDGKAEVLLRTANGVVFGNGAVASGGATNNVQFLSVIDGMTGSELARATVPNPLLADGPMNGHMGILYLDGKRPSVVWAAKNRDAANDFHGVITAWDWRNGSLTQRWSWVDDGSIHAPEGHQIRIADVDNDGKDEFVEIGFVIDDNGTQLFNVAEMVHGDRFHVTDIDPDRPGLENFIIQQNNGTGLATAIFDVGTGSMIKKWYAGAVVDVGRGVAGDFDPAVKGCEFFSTQPGIFDCKGNKLSYTNQPFPPETIWWDSDLVREFVSTIGSSATSPGIDKFSTATGYSTRVISLYSDTAAPNSPYNNYISYGGRPQFWGDILGDWREELLCVATDNSELRIYSARSMDTAKTSNGSTFRIPTLMHNPQYRTQATTKGYVQSNYTDFYLGTGMTPPPPPPMVDAKLVWRGGTGATTWDSGATASWLNNGANSAFASGDSVRFDIGSDNTTTVALSGTLQPAAVTVYSPKNHIFDGSAGSLAGPMTLMKSGSASMTLSGNHSFSGKTAVWDGAFVMNGSLTQSPLIVWGGTWGGTLAVGLKGGRVAGTGTFNQPVTLAYRGGVTPGTGMGNAGTLNFAGGVTAQDGSYFAMDLSTDPSGVGTPNDKVAITGNFSLSGKVGLVVKPLGAQLAPGTYTLITYTGTLTGNVSNFAVTVPAGTPYTLAVAAGAVTLTVPVTRAPAAIVWRGSGGTWDLATSQNWLKAGSPDVFVSGDTVTFDATGAASPTVTLASAMPVSGITVNSTTNYTFSGAGSISGTGGLTKSGTGTLTLNTVNDYTGPTTITGGVLAIATLGDAGTPGSIGAATAVATNFVINGGTLRLTGAQTNTNRNLTLGSSGGTLDVFTAGSSMQISGAVSGTGRLTKAGVGTVILASTNTYSGGTTIDGGTIYLAGSNANKNALGSGAITLNNGTLTMANVQNNDVCNWNLIIPAGATGRLNADRRCSLNGTLTGSGNFTYYSPYVRSDMKGNWSAFNGQINLATDADGSEMRVTNTYGFGTAALNIGADGFVYYNISSSSPVLDIGELTGDATTGIGSGPTAGRTVTWRVGGRNTDATFSGAIVNSTGTTAITKNGSGIWTLAGACTHTGATTVSAGTLRIDGTTTGSAVTVQSAAALGGTGTITGNVTVQTGGILEHGATGAPLAIIGNLTFGANAVVRPLGGLSLSPGTYTVATYTGTLTGAPAFSWQAPAGSPLVAAFSTATPGVITMTLSQNPGIGTPENLTWTGNASSDWDSATQNWSDGVSPAVFSADTTVSFTNSGNAAAAINLVANVQPTAVIVNTSQNYTFSGTGVIADPVSGTATLNKSGSGMLTLTGTNTYSGGTTIAGGTLKLSSNVSFSAGGIGTGGVVFENGALAHGYVADNTLMYLNTMSVAAGQTGTILTPNRFRLNGAITGAGTLNMTITTLVSRADFQNNFTGFSGNLNLTGSGGIRVGINSLGTNQPLFDAAGWANTTLSIDGATLTPTLTSARTIPIGALASTGTAGTLSGGTGGTATYSIGAKNLNTNYSGKITGNAALTKTGTGNLTLGGANTYTGITTVSSGKLTVTGSLAGTVTTVAATATLGGGGTIGGPVTCNGTLAPGTSAGTLTLSNGLVLAPSSILSYELGTVSDRTNVNGDLTLAGTLNVSALAGFGPGSYPLITYTGTLTDEDGLQIANLPANYEATVSTATPGQVLLVVTAILTPFEEWQIVNFGSTTAPEAAATADPDGDGTANETEFRLALDPKNGSSSFKVTGTTGPGGFALTWPSAPGLVFEVRRSATMTGQWDLLDTLAPIATGPASYTDPAPPQPQAFYRIILLP